MIRSQRESHPIAAAACGLAILLIPVADLAAQAPDLIVNGDFESVAGGKSLRRDARGQDWYESRHDGKAGRGLLKLSTRDIGGNATRKAMIKGDLERNTYLSQRFASPLTGRFTVQYDIYVGEILPRDDRSAFCFLGGIRDKKNGPNSTGSERFVFLGFQNGAAGGLIDLFAREGQTKWSERTVVAPNLELGRWYTVVIEANVPDGFYRVKVEGVTDWFELESFYHRGKTPKRITHLSFASWNDGAGTFYVDNVHAWTR